MSKPGPKPISPETRFWAKVEKTATCWLWKGTTSRGYGNFRVGSSTDGTRRKVLAHRFSYELAYGPTDLLVLHKNECHNPLCVRPDHLYAGTYEDNNNDVRELTGWIHPDQR